MGCDPRQRSNAAHKSREQPEWGGGELEASSDPLTRIAHRAVAGVAGGQAMPGLLEVGFSLLARRPEDRLCGRQSTARATEHNTSKTTAGISADVWPMPQMGAVPPRPEVVMVDVGRARHVACPS